MFAATIELVARHGVAGVRYEEVAELSGVHRTSIYRNWPTRDGLVREAIAGYADDMAPVPDTGDLRTDLVEFLCRLAGALITPTGRAIVQALQLAAPGSPDLHELARRLTAERLAAVQRRLDGATAAGQLPPVDAAQLNELLAGPVHYRVNAGEEFTRADAERIVDVVLAGLRSTAGKPTGRSSPVVR